MIAIETHAQEPQAWAVTFGAPETVEKPLPFGRASHDVAAIYKAVDAAAPPPTNVDGYPTLALLWLPPGVTDAAALESAWLGSPPAEGPFNGRRVVRAGVREILVVMANGRAVVRCGASLLEEAKDAIGRMFWIEHWTALIELKMAETWTAIEAVRQLIYADKMRDLHRRRLDIFDLAGKATEMKGTLLRLQRAIAQLDPSINPVAKRLHAELLEQAEIYERVETLSDQVDYAMQLSEAVTQRMFDYQTRRGSHWLEIGILVVLVAELVVMLINFHF